MTEITIAVVEDDHQHVELFRNNLSPAGVRVDIQVFRSGQELLSFLFRTGDFAHRPTGLKLLVLLGLHLTEMDGVEVLRRVKGEIETRSVPVVVFSSNDARELVEECYQLGCNAFITKPRESAGFVDAIRCLGSFLSVIKVPPCDGLVEPFSAVAKVL